MHKQKRTWIALASVGATCLFASATLAQAKDDTEKTKTSKQAKNKKTSGKTAQIGVESDAPYGQYLVDAEGKTLYMFTADDAGQSSCYDECAKAWPPVLTTGDPVLGEKGMGLDAEKLGTIERRDGKKQVTYAGHPLYYFERDTPQQEISGQAIVSFGGAWHLLSPGGDVIKTTAEKPQPKESEATPKSTQPEEVETVPPPAPEEDMQPPSDEPSAPKGT